MSNPIFFWTVVQRFLLGTLALIIALLFWVLAVVFLLTNLVLSWFRLWRWVGVWNLVTLRFLMRWRNLYDTSQLPHANPSTDPRNFRWDARYQYQRTADGTFNDLEQPGMGSTGTRFGRNFPLARLRVETERFLEPNPRTVSRTLLTRKRFRPATSLNLIAAAWIQFQVHDWFSHKRREPRSQASHCPNDYLPAVPVQDDRWPGKDKDGHGNRVMWIRRTEPDPTLARHSTDLPTFLNMETHWWDGSQLYGSSQRVQDLVRAGRQGHLCMQNRRRLPAHPDPALTGMELSGFTDNWWVGLSLLHTLFSREHNAICDRLSEVHPDWDDERLFQTARLINAALMAKIHTIEWTPAILGHPTLLIGMKANWWGILTQRLTQTLGRFKFLRGIQEEVSGIPGSERDHHFAPYYLTEEFVSVYRMHPLIPDDYRFFNLATDELIREGAFKDIEGQQTRSFMNDVPLEDLFYSFGLAHPGEITLHNFPRALQAFVRIKENSVTNELLDLGTVDIVRDRERAVPRYNQFRRMLLLLPTTSYRRLVGLPRFRLFSGLSRRDMAERANWVEDLKTLYPDEENLDLMVGLFAEKRPKGFGFSDSAFRIFILMASRRLKSDRFFTTDYKAEVYTQTGIDWIDNNTFKTVLQRHYPQLTGSLADVGNPFTPWHRTQPPPTDPKIEPDVKTAYAPIFVGVGAGWILGAALFLVERGLSFQTLLSAPVQNRAFLGVAAGGVVGAASMGIVNLISLTLTGRVTARQRAEIFGSLGALLGGALGVTHLLYGPWRWGALFRAIVSGTAVTWAVIGVVAGVCVVRAYDLFKLARAPGPLPPRCRVEAGAIYGLALGWTFGLIEQIGWSRPEWQSLSGAFLSASAMTGALVGLGLGTAVATIYDSLFTPAPQSGWRRIAWAALLGAGLGGLVTVVHGLGGNWRDWSALYAAVFNWKTALLLVIGAGLGAMLAAIHVPSHTTTPPASPPSRPLSRALIMAAVVGGILGLLALLVDLYGLLQWKTSGLRALLIAVVLGSTFGTAGAIFWSFAYTPRQVRRPRRVIIRIVVLAGAGAVAAMALSGINYFITSLTGDGPNLLMVLGVMVIGAVAGAVVAAVGSFTIGILLTALAGSLVGLLLFSLGLFTVPYLKALGSAWARNGLLLGALAGALWGARDARCLCRNASWLVVRGCQFAVGGLFVGALLFVARQLLTDHCLPAEWQPGFKEASVNGAGIALIMAAVAWLYWTKEVKWINRRTFWNLLGWAKFAGNKPVDIPPPSPPEAGSLVPIRLRDAIPGIPIDGITVVPREGVPADEQSWLGNQVTRVQVWLYSAFSPMQPDLDKHPVATDAHRALQHAYGRLHRTKLDPPDLPPEYEGSPDLGGLAVRGPYACYTKRIDPHGNPDVYAWDTTGLMGYSCRAELLPLGARVLFRHDPHRNRLRPFLIETPALALVRPGDPQWQLAKKLALCSLTTHLSLVRHFNWVHLAGAAPVALATRNHLSPDHPLCRLLWPHIFGTQQSNDMVTRAQMIKGGDFESIFSFPHDEMCWLFEDSYDDFQIERYDPMVDARTRGIQGGPALSPTQNDLEALFNEIHQHTTSFLRTHATTLGAAPQWRQIQAWLDELNLGPSRVPNGVGVTSNSVTIGELALLCARFIYLVTVEHEMVGSFLWNYQLWTHRQPVRVYRSGQREPLDIYQRLVNANYNLNVERRMLLDDPAYLGVQKADRPAFVKFQQGLRTLNEAWKDDPWRMWRLYPEALKVNINA